MKSIISFFVTFVFLQAVKASGFMPALPPMSFTFGGPGSDGKTLTPETLVSLQKFDSKIDLTESAWEAVKKSREVIDRVLTDGRTVYGINTGFGKFCRVLVSPEKLEILQNNLITSHSCGVGKPISPKRSRCLMALRINVLAKGFSGISPETLQQMVDAFNKGCVSQVPNQGTVGASGDLAPLAHIALGLLGQGEMFSPETGVSDAKSVLENHNLTPLKLKPKEGLALINGTQFISTIGSECLRTADVIAALTLEGLGGSPNAYAKVIHEAKRHKGQKVIAQNLRALLSHKTVPKERSGSFFEPLNPIDPYTLRCIPQVHGITFDTLKFVRKIMQVELNSATDNPMILSDRDTTISGGNFHGEYPAKAMDILAIGVHEIANMSERRMERLCNPSCSHLPAFLAPEGGLNSGFMMAHVTASALVSENKGLCHPSSVDSLSTSAGTEDHVSMGGWAARKALEVVKNVENVLAIELLAACQAIDLRRPYKTTKVLEGVYSLVRESVPFMEEDRFLGNDIAKVGKLVRSGEIYKIAEDYLKNYTEAETGH